MHYSNPRDQQVKQIAQCAHSPNFSKKFPKMFCLDVKFFFWKVLESFRTCKWGKSNMQVQQKLKWGIFLLKPKSKIKWEVQWSLEQWWREISIVASWPLPPNCYEWTAKGFFQTFAQKNIFPKKLCLNFKFKLFLEKRGRNKFLHANGFLLKNARLQMQMQIWNSFWKKICNWKSQIWDNYQFTFGKGSLILSPMSWIFLHHTKLDDPAFGPEEEHTDALRFTPLVGCWWHWY